MGDIWIDGHLVRAQDALISAVTPGVQAGIGVYEALTVVRGEAFACTRHLRRLAASAARLDLTVPFDDAELRAAVGVVLAATPAATKIRITVWAGSGGDPPVVVVNPIVQDPWAATARVVVSEFVRNERAPSVGAKIVSVVDHQLAVAAARRRGADEALLFDTRGHLSEGTASNVFVAVGDELCTPALANGCLPGVTRALICELVPVTERDDITVEDLRAAPEIFLSASTRAVHPVAVLDGAALPRCPGPLTEAASMAYAALQERTLDP